MDQYKIGRAAYLREWKKKNPDKHSANYRRWTMIKKEKMYADVLAERESKAGK